MLSQRIFQIHEFFEYAYVMYILCNRRKAISEGDYYSGQLNLAGEVNAEKVDRKLV